MDEETNGSEFTAPADYPGFKLPEKHTLPSGAVFLLRKPQVMKMMQRGQIPNPLMEIVNGVFEERDAVELVAEAKAKGMTTEELLEQRRAEALADAEDPTKPPPIPDADVEKITPEMALQFRDVVVWAAIVAPAVEIAPMVNGTPLTASGALSYDALDEQDILYILQFANGDLPSTATFPAESERETSRPDRGEVERETELVAGHPA